MSPRWESSTSTPTSSLVACRLKLLGLATRTTRSRVPPLSPTPRTTTWSNRTSGSRKLSGMPLQAISMSPSSTSPARAPTPTGTLRRWNNSTCRFEDGSGEGPRQCPRSQRIFFLGFEFRPPLQALSDLLLVSKCAWDVERAAPQAIGEVLLREIGVRRIMGVAVSPVIAKLLHQGRRGVPDVQRYGRRRRVTGRLHGGAKRGFGAV